MGSLRPVKKICWVPYAPRDLKAHDSQQIVKLREWLHENKKSVPFRELSLIAVHCGFKTRQGNACSWRLQLRSISAIISDHNAPPAASVWAIKGDKASYKQSVHLRFDIFTAVEISLQTSTNPFSYVWSLLSRIHQNLTRPKYHTNSGHYAGCLMLLQKPW